MGPRRGANFSLSASEAARRIERGELTSEALVAACLERIAERDEQVRAWAFVNRDYALAQARAARPRRAARPLHGMPFGIKDVIDTAEHADRVQLADLPRPPAEGGCRLRRAARARRLR